MRSRGVQISYNANVRGLCDSHDGDSRPGEGRAGWGEAGPASRRGGLGVSEQDAETERATASMAHYATGISSGASGTWRKLLGRDRGPRVNPQVNG